MTDVALASGYESAQSLARTFRTALDAAAGDLRGNPVRIAAARRRLQPATANEPAALQVEVVSLAPFEVVAVRRQGAFDALDAGFAQLFDWAARADLAGSITGLHGVPLGDHRDLATGQLIFDCAIGLDAVAPAVPLPLRRQMLGGGLYARVRHVGAYSGLEALTDQVLRGWWPDSGHELRQVPIHYTFLDDPDEVPAALLRADLYLPLRA